MSLLASGSLARLPDQPTISTTFYCFGADKIDVTAYGFDVRLEIMRPNGGWEDPQRIPAGLHKSFPGLSVAYDGGAAGFRLSNYTAGKVASCDYEAVGAA